jgi:hypothetical protein
MVSGIDNAIGRFMRALEAQGLADNTIIVYTADNGFHLGNRGFAGKWSHYEESLRVPLIILDPRAPRSAHGQVVDYSALNLDLPSTFLDWAELNVPKRYQGRSLKSIVTSGKVENWRKHTFHEHFAVRSRIPAFEGIRNDRYKYVRYIDEDNYEFLHDLKKDPDELTNFAKDPKYIQTLEMLRKQTDKKVAELGGPLSPAQGKLSVSTPPHPVAAATVANRPEKDGFSKIIGSGMRGWSGDSKFWSHKKGVLIGKTDGTLKKNHFITWKVATVRNFDLRVKVRISKGGNSGIQYRSAHAPELGLDVVTGYQCDIVTDKPQFNGMVYEEKGRRILSHAGEKVIVDSEGNRWVIDNFEVKEFAPDQWHEYRILVEGNRHRHWINGHPTGDLIDLDRNGRALDGVLAMQVHKGPPMTIEFKEMQIKHLPDELPILQPKDHPIPANARGVRPQGRLPKDWKAPIYGKG